MIEVMGFDFVPSVHEHTRRKDRSGQGGGLRHQSHLFPSLCGACRELAAELGCAPREGVCRGEPRCEPQFCRPLVQSFLFPGHCLCHRRRPVLGAVGSLEALVLPEPTSSSLVLWPSWSPCLPGSHACPIPDHCKAQQWQVCRPGQESPLKHPQSPLAWPPAWPQHPQQEHADGDRASCPSPFL